MLYAAHGEQFFGLGAARSLWVGPSIRRVAFPIRSRPRRDISCCANGTGRSQFLCLSAWVAKMWLIYALQYGLESLRSIFIVGRVFQWLLMVLGVIYTCRGSPGALGVLPLSDGSRVAGSGCGACWVPLWPVLGLASAGLAPGRRRRCCCVLPCGGRPWEPNGLGNPRHIHNHSIIIIANPFIKS